MELRKPSREPRRQGMVRVDDTLADGIPFGPSEQDLAELQVLRDWLDQAGYFRRASPMTRSQAVMWLADALWCKGYLIEDLEDELSEIKAATGRPQDECLRILWWRLKRRFGHALAQRSQFRG